MFYILRFSTLSAIFILLIVKPVISQNPIAHYTFENSASDISGNGHNGTLVNGAAFSTLQFKDGSFSLQLDGVNDYVDIGTIDLGNQFTFASWVYIPAGSSNIRTLIANAPSGANRNGFKIFVNTYGTSDRKIILETGNGSISGHATSEASVFAFAAWNHIAVTVDKTTGTAKIYYNGSDVTSLSAILTNFSSNNALRLGITTNSLYAMRSNIDDTRLYNRVLSASEIAALAEAEPPQITVPNPPGGLTATGGINSVSLSWNDNSTNEDGFTIERSLTPGSGFGFLLTTAANVESFTDMNAQAGTTYYYRVKAFNEAGSSAYSNEASATPSEPPSGGDLLVRYTFENSALDISGNGHNGTLVNGAAFSTSQFKEGSYSLQLDGVNDYVSLGTIDLGNQFSFASWVYIPAGSSNIRTLIANAPSGASSNGFKIFVNTYGTSDRKIIMETGNGSTSGHATSAASVFAFATWNHIAVTVDKTTGIAKIYYNGSDVTTVSAILTNFSSNNAVRLGITTNSQYALRSNMDDTRLYNKVLSASEVAALAEAEPPQITIPNPPGGLTANGSINSVSLSWNDNSTNEDGFTIERSLTPGSGFGLLHTTAANAESFTDLTAHAGNTYYYRIKAFNEAGSSAYSNEASATALNPPSNLDFVVMPLGNSLTSDDYSGDVRPIGLRPGYRQNLYLALVEYGYTSIDFRGSRRSGFNSVPAFDADHEGHPGYTAAQVADSVYYWLSDNPAGIVILEIGTNGLTSSTTQVEEILDKIDLFEQENNILIKVILAQIPNRSIYSSLTTTFNNNLAAMAASRVNEGDYIVLVDMENDAGLNYNLEPSGDMRDNLHPNQNGYNKMAQLYFDSIVTVLPPITPNTPVSPSGLTSAAISGAVNLSWDDNSYIENGYTVERKEQGSAIFSVIASIPRNSRNYTDTDVMTDETYTYRVRAFNTSGNSGYSNESEVTVQEDDPLSVGLIAHYTFENSATDISGNGNHGALLNGAGFSASSKEGNFCLALDGVNDYVDLGTVNFGNRFTFASWVYIPSGSSNIRTLLANASSGATRNGFKMTVNQYATTNRRIILETGNGTASGYGLSPVSTVAFDSWNHIAVTADLTTGVARIYYNGNEVTESSSILSDFQTNSNTRLGIMTNSNFPMRGNLDDTRLYNRVLSPSEILQLATLPVLKSSFDQFLNDSGEIIRVYPNPFRDHLIIQATGVIENVEVYSALGTRVREFRNVNSSELLIKDPGDLNMYIIKVTTKENRIHTVKVLRNK